MRIHIQLDPQGASHVRMEHIEGDTAKKKVMTSFCYEDANEDMMAKMFPNDLEGSCVLSFEQWLEQPQRTLQAHCTECGLELRGRRPTKAEMAVALAKHDVQVGSSMHM